MTRGWSKSMNEAFHSLVNDYRSDYAMGTNSRFRPQPSGISVMGSGADYHWRNETQYMRGLERARHFDRNNMIVGQGVNRLVSNVLQDGFNLDIKTGDDGLDDDLNARWKEWSTDPAQCDYEGEKDFNELAGITLRSTFVDGDVISVGDSLTGTLRTFEAHRARTPQKTRRNVFLGFLKNESGKKLEVWITRTETDPRRPVQFVRDIKPFPIFDENGNRNVFQSYFPTRHSQTRGASAFCPIVDAIGMHDDIQFATLVKQQVASCYTIFEEIEEGSSPPGDEDKTGVTSTDNLSDGSTRTVEGISPGMRITGTPGMKLSGFSPNIPSAEFFQHAMLVLTFIAINLDLPVSVLLLDPSNTNFSGWRGAVDQARLRFRKLQADFIKHYHTPIYRWKVRQWMAEDAAITRISKKSGISIFNHKFKARGFAYIEPSKDALADKVRSESAIASLNGLADEKGIDWDDLSTDIVNSRAMLIQKAWDKAEELKAYGIEDLSWRELAPMPLATETKDLIGFESNKGGDQNA